MAEPGRLRKKPRIRKSAPTIRERAAAAAEEADKPHVSKLKATASSVGRPFSKVKLPSNPITRAAVKILRVVKRVLGWLVPRYFINSWREVKKVTWPTRKETRRLTLAVFIFALVFGAIAAIVDKGLDELFRKLVLK